MDIGGVSIMRIENLGEHPANSVFDADIVIVGGGPAGLTIASEFIGSRLNVLVLESGVETELPAYSDLNRLDSDGEPHNEAAVAFRKAYHGPNCASFDNDAQPYGIRIRSLGGAGRYWGGRSGLFDEIDFQKRDWVPHSGWPIARSSLEPYFERAAQVLNLGPNIYDERLWPLVAGSEGMRRPPVDKTRLISRFWQFARSRLNPNEIMNFVSEFKQVEASNIRLMINATVTHIDTDATGEAFESLEICTIEGVRSRVRAKRCVLASGAIENARLLLVSNRVHAEGLGNRHDVVGRYLMDHPGVRIGCFRGKDIPASAFIGFYAIQHEGRSIMYAHGFSLSPELQASEKLLNGAVYSLPEIAHDDPVEALKRLAKFRSRNLVADLWALVASMGLLLRSIGAKLLQSSIMPAFVRRLVIDYAMRVNPGLVVREFQSKGVPHKLDAIGLHVIIEQQPDPESRIVLTEARDALGVRQVRAHWKMSGADRRTAIRIAQLLAEELPKAGMPAPDLDSWVRENRPEDAPLVDMAHSMGTTRMSDDPRAGVVDSNCQVHGVKGLYIAGSSVFPTAGQCNPTLMLLSLAIRLADQIRADLTPSATIPAGIERTASPEAVMRGPAWTG